MQQTAKIIDLSAIQNFALLNSIRDADAEILDCETLIKRLQCELERARFRLDSVSCTRHMLAAELGKRQGGA